MSGTANEQACKLIWKSKNGQEFFVFANPGAAAKWKKDKSIPLIDVVQAFNVYTNEGARGNQGALIQPPKGILQSEFGTDDGDAIVRKIVEEGEEKNV
ncbi:ribosome maturation protein [Syncephalastrum racemosum]|uniref:Ribosome maturation protein n=1 Tax=Syncephalastrum racemosum TaxID=13706 RepID=A0A1X2H4Z4_SYNRA|nr:ribosome maturation protein [Syncephalastrum racemosum]